MLCYVMLAYVVGFFYMLCCGIHKNQTEISIIVSF